MPVASCQLLVASKYGSRRPPVFTGNWQLATRNYSSGFTLVEMLTVLAIIVLVLASAVPVFNSLTGNHSLAAAQNQIASLLQTARQDAIYNRQTMGIFFYIDPATDAVAMAEVQLDQQQGGGTTYSPSEIYVSPTNTQSTAPPQGQVNAIEMANYWDPSLTAPGQVGTGEFVYYRDVVTLPANVGIALYNNSVPYPANGEYTPPIIDRYVRTGAIFFDSTGALASIPYAVQQTRITPYGTFQNHLGIRLGLRGAGDPSGLNATGDLASDINDYAVSGTPVYYFPLISQVGLLFYDRSAYFNQRTTNPADVNGPRAFTDQDLQYTLPPLSSPPNNSPLAYFQADKSDEEIWLDQNGQAVMVNPFNGALIFAK